MMQQVPLVAAILVIAPVLSAGAPVQVATETALAGTLTLNVNGAGHVVLEAQEPFVIQSSEFLSDATEAWHAALFTMRETYFYRQYLHGPEFDYPASWQNQEFGRGTYDLYMVGPGSFSFRIITNATGDLEADAAPWWGEIRIMNDPVAWLGLREPDAAAEVPARILRTSFDVPARSLLVVFERSEFEGFGVPGGIVGTTVHRSLSPELQQSCMGVALYDVFGLAPTHAGFTIGSFSGVEAGAWQLGADTVEGGNMVLQRHVAVAIATRMSDEDPTLTTSAISYTLAEFGVPGVLHGPIEQAACAGVWNPFEPPLSELGAGLLPAPG